MSVCEANSIHIIRWNDYCAIMSLLEDSEQKLAGLRSPRPREAREALQQAVKYLCDHIKWTGSKRTGHITQADFERFVWALNYALGYLDNLLSMQATASRRNIEYQIKPLLDHITWQTEQIPV